MSFSLGFAAWLVQELPERSDHFLLTSFPFLLFYFVDNGDEEAEGDKSTRRQHEEQDVERLGQQREAEDGARAQNLTTDAQQRQAQREAEADADAIEERSHGRVLRGETLSTSEDDTVDHNQRDEQSQRGVDFGQEGLDDHLEDGDERGDHHDEYGDANLVGRDRLKARDDDVGADEHGHCGQTHRHAVHGRGGRGQRGTHTQHQDERGVLLYYTIFDYTYITHILFFIFSARRLR